MPQNEHLKWGAVEVREALPGDQGGWLVDTPSGVRMQFGMPDTAPTMERHVLSYDEQRISEGRRDKEHFDV